MVIPPSLDLVDEPVDEKLAKDLIASHLIDLLLRRIIGFNMALKVIRELKYAIIDASR